MRRIFLHDALMRELAPRLSGDSAKPTKLLLKSGIIKVVLLCLLAFAVLYTTFSIEVNSTFKRPPQGKADGLVVLTGDAYRIARGVELLKSGYAKRLLISGVGEKTTRQTIAGLINEEKVFRGCCIDIDRIAKNTADHAYQTADWVARNSFLSVVLVTSDYHMPRSLYLMKREMPHVRIIPFAIRNNTDAPIPFISSMFSTVFFWEFMKYVSVRSGLEPTVVRAMSALGYGRHH